MIPSYGERDKEFAIMAYVVDETAEAHVVEVTIHDRFDEISVQLKVFKNGRWFGVMIPWLALRIALLDLAAQSFERERRIDGRRLAGDVWPVNVAEYLKTLGSIPALQLEANDLPEHILHASRMYLAEGVTVRDFGITAENSSLHNARKIIFDLGLPDKVTFSYLYKQGPKSTQKWFPRVVINWSRRVHQFHGFDWRTSEGAAALEEFLGMLNLWHPIDVPAMKPPRIRPHATGPKDWAPEEAPAVLEKGVDYGPELT